MVAFQNYGSGYVATRTVGGKQLFAACLNGQWLIGLDGKVREYAEASGARCALTRAANAAPLHAATPVASAPVAAAVAAAAAVAPQMAERAPMNWESAERVIDYARACFERHYGKGFIFPGNRGKMKDLSHSPKANARTRAAAAILNSLAIEAAKGKAVDYARVHEATGFLTPVPKDLPRR